MATIAFLGTGVMGVGMAGSLMRAGHDLRVYNRTAEKALPLVRAGATIELTPRATANGADAIFAMVADDEASEDVWLGHDGALAADLAPGTICVECSTLSHAWVQQLEKAVRADGHAYIDCPVTGYPHMAEAGELTLLVGADDVELERARPYLDTLSTGIIHFGGVGTGTAYKLMINLMGAVQIAATAEGLAIAEKAGLDRDTVVDAICKGAAASPQVVRNAGLMAAGNFDKDVTFTGALRLKDVRYAMAFAEAMNMNPPFGSVAADAFSTQVEQGWGALSESKIVDVLAKLTEKS